MNPKDLFTREKWAEIGDLLRGVAKAWWEEHREVLIGIASDEIREVGDLLREGKTTEAKMLLAGRMDPDDFAAYVRGTTSELKEISQKRAALFEALEDLGLRVARTIGAAIVGAFV